MRGSWPEHRRRGGWASKAGRHVHSPRRHLPWSKTWFGLRRLVRRFGLDLNKVLA